MFLHDYSSYPTFRTMAILRFSPAFLLLFIHMAFSSPVSAQAIIAMSESERISNYADRIFGADPELVSGNYYIGPNRGAVSGHPYFAGEEWEYGYLISNGKKYENLLLNYDIYNKSVILQYVTRDNSTTRIIIRSDRIDEFEMGERKFIPLPEILDSSKIVFCELISEGEGDGKVTYMVLKSKSFNLANGSSARNYEYTLTIKQYLRYNGVLGPFKGLKSLYKFLPEQKKSIRKYISDMDMKPVPRNIEDRVKVIAFCNSLIPGEK